MAGQAGLINERGHIISGGKALTADSVSSMVAGVVGGAPAAAYIESAAGTAAGGKTGLTATLVGVLFPLMILPPLSYLAPAYATALALMYVGLLMLGNVTKLDFNDSVDALSGMLCAVFIVLTCNIVTGIMLGFVALVVGRLFAAEWKKLNIGTRQYRPGAGDLLCRWLGPSDQPGYREGLCGSSFYGCEGVNSSSWCLLWCFRLKRHTPYRSKFEQECPSFFSRLILR